jgi:transcriptional regulator with XRE-family HTH domain
MTLNEYLHKRGIRQADFAGQIGRSAAYVSMLCAGKIWPSREVVSRIHNVTRGKVSANDFMQPDEAAQ